MDSRHDEELTEVSILSEQAEAREILQHAIEHLPDRLSRLGVTIDFSREDDILDVVIGTMPEFFYTMSGNGTAAQVHFDAETDEIVGITVERMSDLRNRHTHAAFRDLITALDEYGTVSLMPARDAAERLANDLRELVPA